MANMNQQRQSAGAKVLKLLRKNPEAGERVIYAAKAAVPFGNLELKDALHELWSELAAAAFAADDNQKDSRT